MLADVLANESAARSATTELRELQDPARRLAQAAAQYVDAVAQAPREAAGAAPPPLPWLSDRPRPADPAWSRYLDDRSALVTQLADQVRQTAVQRVARARPGTALSRQDPDLVAAREVFLAAHGRAVGPDDLDEKERRYLSVLQRNIDQHQRDALRSADGIRSATRPQPGSLSLSISAATYVEPGMDRGPSL